MVSDFITLEMDDLFPFLILLMRKLTSKRGKPLAQGHRARSGNNLAEKNVGFEGKLDLNF